VIYKLISPDEENFEFMLFGRQGNGLIKFPQKFLDEHWYNGDENDHEGRTRWHRIHLNFP
jgi:hypothetical protein